MSKHVIFMRLTERGASDIDSAIAALEGVRADLFEPLSITEESLLLTMGQYDVVTVFDTDDPSYAAFYSLELARTGYFHTETVCGFGREEFKTAVAQIRLTRGRVE